MNNSPLSLNASREQKQLIVTWEDGHVSVYSFSLLRAGCPCAECRGGHEKMGAVPDPLIFTLDLPDSPATRLKTIQPVGSYAITPVWEDGHDYGIYQWAYLRLLCPCAECRK